MSSISALANSNNQNMIWSLLTGGTSTAATPATATSASFQAQLQSWLTSLQSAASTGTTSAAAQTTSQGPTNTGDPDDTTAAADSAQSGTVHHHHHHHHGGGTDSASADSTDSAGSLTGGTTGVTSGSIIGSTPGTSQTGGSLAQMLAADVARAVQAYSSGASSRSGALSTIA
jgi:hypothetical protein